MKPKQSKPQFILKRDNIFWRYTNLQKKILHLKKLFFLIILFFASFLTNILASNDTKIEKISIEGKVINLSQSGNINFEGLDIVLLKYVLNPNGEVIPNGPQNRVKSKKNGMFRFENITPDYKAGFQLGTRFEGELYSSKIFFMKKGETRIKKNISIPKISFDVDKLEISKLSIVIEAGLGEVLITEILEISNRSNERIDAKNNPIKYSLPTKIHNFKVLNNEFNTFIEFDSKENILKIGNIFQVGITQIIYQYMQTSYFGSLKMKRVFDHSLGIVGIFTPVNLLSIRSEMIEFTGKQKFNKTTFLSWKSKISDLNLLEIKINNVPQTSLQYFFVTVVLLVIFLCIVLIFFRKKINKVN